MNWTRVGILTDEVSADLDDALDWAAEQRLAEVELRVVDGTNVADLTDAQAAGVRRRLKWRGLAVSAVSSPVFKCALDPTRPVASGDRFGQAEEGVEAHFAKLDRVIAVAGALGTSRIRIFSFWREVDPAAHHAEIVGHLARAARVAERAGVLLLVENEPACNGGFAAEVAELVRGVGSPAVRALWDPGNEVYGGREAFPAGYADVRDLLAHVHLKDAYHRRDGTPKCVPLGSGDLPLIGQLRALAADGYDGPVTIETHFAPAGGTPKAGSRLSLDALRILWKEAGLAP